LKDINLFLDILKYKKFLLKSQVKKQQKDNKFMNSFLNIDKDFHFGVFMHF